MRGNRVVMLFLVLASAASCAPTVGTGECEKTGKGGKELCEGLEALCDNNENGDVDEGCGTGGFTIQCDEGESVICEASPNDQVHVGLCRQGRKDCKNRQYPQSCENFNEPRFKDECGNRDSKGNLVDDDCNGQTDEDCECIPGDRTRCGTDTGICEFGYMVCGDDYRWIQECKEQVGPAPQERCTPSGEQPKDEDCNGATDDSNAVDAHYFYWDADGDGQGNPNIRSANPGCTPLSGYVDNQDDCDDSNAAIHKGNVVELCDGVDNNCDGDIDSRNPSNIPLDAPTWVVDLDDDGFGNPASSLRSCEQPVGHVLDQEDPRLYDCDDGNELIHPNADELCNGEDDDCDGVTDPPDSADATRHFADTDEDGHGGALAEFRFLCSDQVVNGILFLSSSDDCDDGNAAIHPGQLDICGNVDAQGNGIDDNCNPLDDDLGIPFFVDADGDGLGDASKPRRFLCTLVSGVSNVAGDCDDANPAVKDGDSYCKDADEDGYCDPGAVIVSCTHPDGYLVPPTDPAEFDCDDRNELIHPQADEFCDLVDNNCNGTVDEKEALDAKDWLFDGDRDGFGDPSVPERACAQPRFFVQKPSDPREFDCKDGSINIHPRAAEYCNGVDDNCDGIVDELESVDAKSFYRDADGDGIGTDAVAAGQIIPQVVKGCGNPPLGYSLRKDDCNDGNGTVFPGNIQQCGNVDANGRLVDSNCNPADDADFAGTPICRDVDGDGFGNPANCHQACANEVGFVANNKDCNDASAQIHPNATELCDGVDNDCNAQTDENTDASAPLFRKDGDEDGFGSATEFVHACANPSTTFVSFILDAPLQGVDCDDNDPDVHPGAAELCDGVDNNCDGQKDPASSVDASQYDYDGDRDGFGDPTDSRMSCSKPDYFVLHQTDPRNQDCNDASAQIRPGAAEFCNGVDNDCDGLVNESNSSDAKAWIPDGDDDGYGVGILSIPSCVKPANFALQANGIDCDDSNPGKNPGMLPVCGQPDNNCNPADDLVGNVAYKDTDGDTYGDPATAIQVCGPQAGCVLRGGDCRDDLPNVNPSAGEICGNGLDDNCSGGQDEASAVNAGNWYTDADTDGTGDKFAAPVKACTKPAGKVAVNTDCNDYDIDIHEGAAEICDGVDNNCDGQTDEPNASAPLFRADPDRDNYGSKTVTMNACTQPPDFVPDAPLAERDCRDDRSDIHPNAPEFCNGVDLNCDTLVNQPNSVDARTSYFDADGDGVGASAAVSGQTAPQTQQGCTAPAGYSFRNDDCDPLASNIHPGAPEICGNAVDEDCIPGNESGGSTYCRDADLDSYGNPSICQQSCSPLAGFVTNSADCDDTRFSVNPAAAERCGDGLDNDCKNGVDDPGAVDVQTFFNDADVDSFGSPTDTERKCTPSVGYVTNGNDCDDRNNTILDGFMWCYDGDGDTFCVSSVTRKSCTQPQFFVSLPSNPSQFDCNDGNNTIHVGAQEVCNGLDDDCDMIIDEMCVAGGGSGGGSGSGAMSGGASGSSSAATASSGMAAASSSAPAASSSTVAMSSSAVVASSSAVVASSSAATASSSAMVGSSSAAAAGSSSMAAGSSSAAAASSGAAAMSSSAGASSVGSSSAGVSGSSASSSGGSSSAAVASSSAAAATSGSSSTTGSSSGALQSSPAELASYDAQGGPGCTAAVCLNTIEVFIRSITFPGTQFAGASSPSLKLRSYRVEYQQGNAGCGTTLYCAPEMPMTASPLSFSVTPNEYWRLVARSEDGTDFRSTFQSPIDWQLDPTNGGQLNIPNRTAFEPNAGETWAVTR